MVHGHPSTKKSNDLSFLVWLSTKCFPQVDVRSLKDFMQKMANRLQVGHVQYGTPNKKKCYMTRIEKELKAYQKTGNAEHLYNIANYAWLETVAPEHKKFHFDNSVDSVTRPTKYDRGVFSFHEH